MKLSVLSNENSVSKKILIKLTMAQKKSEIMLSRHIVRLSFTSLLAARRLATHRRAAVGFASPQQSAYRTLPPPSPALSTPRRPLAAARRTAREARSAAPRFVPGPQSLLALRVGAASTRPRFTSPDGISPGGARFAAGMVR